MPYHLSVVMIWCFYIEHDLQSNHTLEHVHVSPCKTIPLLSESAEPSAKKKYKFRPAEQTEEHFVLSVLMGDGNSSTAKLQVFKETFNISKFKILPFNKERVLNCLQKLIFNVCFET